MVEILAIVHRKRASSTSAELSRIGCAGYSRFAVLGRGREGGLRGEQAGTGVAFLPKTLFDLVVDDEHEAETIEAIIRANQTGQFGDGKIFVVEMADAYRISTGQPEAVA